MDFVAEHPALEDGRRSLAAARLAETYQLLGLAWEFLALQCRHTQGFRRTRDGKRVCRTCGTVAGTEKRWILLPRCGQKTIGRRTVPSSTEVLPNRRTAQLIDDAIRFHGTQLRVDVHNAHRTSLFRSRNVSAAAERIVTLEEDGVVCGLDGHMAHLRFVPRRRGAEPPFGAFVFELPRRVLKRFPVMLEYDRRGRFVGLCVFRTPMKRRARRGAK